jgi:aminoglycoside 6'-N-acetyltransferase I
MTLTIRILTPDDDAILTRVAPEVFDNPVDPALTREFLSDPRHHLAVALDGDRVVGMASALHYVHPDKPPELWINELGVDPAYQRRGAGKRLLEALFDRGRSLGCGEAWVLTDRENLPALALYGSLGGRDEDAVMFSFTLGDDR